jgi:hypothetical protein
MGVAVFAVLALLVGAFIAYPLLPGRSPARLAPAVTDAEIDRAVRRLRRVRSKSGLFCPSCGQGYRPEDRFCVRCGQALPEVQPAPAALACSTCGAPLRQEDQFCSKCGTRVPTGEVA